MDSVLTNLPHISNDHRDLTFPKVSVIIPTYNCAQWMTVTLENLVHQEYPDLEIIVVDSNSTDRTVAVVKSYYRGEAELIVHSVSSQKIFEMINTGLLHSHGTYVNVLFPGNFYIHLRVLRTMMALAYEHEWPEMVYCGSVVHGRDGCGSVFHEGFSADLLRKNRQPTNLQSCWFRGDLFRKLGKFSTEYPLRADLDLMCRMALDDRVKVVGTTQVLTDSDQIASPKSYRSIWETVQILYKRFGWRAPVDALFGSRLLF